MEKEKIMEKKRIDQLSIYPYENGESPKTYLNMYKLRNHILNVKAKIERNLTDDKKKHLGTKYIDIINERYKSLFDGYNNTLDPGANLYNGPYKNYSPKKRIILLEHDNVKEELSIEMTERTQKYAEMQKEKAVREYLGPTGFSGQKTPTSRRTPTSPTSRRTPNRRSLSKSPNRRSLSKSPKGNSLLLTLGRTFGRRLGKTFSLTKQQRRTLNPETAVASAELVFKKDDTKSQAGGKKKKKYNKTKPKPKTKPKTKPKSKSKK